MIDEQMTVLGAEIKQSPTPARPMGSYEKQAVFIIIFCFRNLGHMYTVYCILYTPTH